MRVIPNRLISTARSLMLGAALLVPFAVFAQPQGSAGDQELEQRVRNALHADPYFYDEHVTVAVQAGKVVLHGFVFSDWDLQNALRIANQAAAGHRVVDDLSIKEGGRR